MKKILALWVICFSVLFAQQKKEIETVPRDTSYTLYSAARKMYKKFPQAKLITREHSEKVKEESNIVYENIGSRELHADVFYPVNSERKRLPGV